jgi:Glycosyl transferase 4-like domain
MGRAMRRARHLPSRFAGRAIQGGPAAPPKLLHVSIGGRVLRSYFAGQLAFMRAQGFQVVLAAAGGPDLERLCRAEGARPRPVAIPRTLCPWRDLKALFGLLRIMAEERPSIVHCHSPKATLLGMLAASILGIPHRIHHLRALPLETELPPMRWLLYASELLVSRLCTETVAISDSLRQSYRRHPGCVTSRSRCPAPAAATASMPGDGSTRDRSAPNG